jgi:enoyl-CoA hydratase/carnithine racemase
MQMVEYENIICEVRGGVGCLTLNSERTLNSLTVPMINEVHSVLKAWKSDPEISCVFLQGAGEKAFCAGGDVRKLRERVVSYRETAPDNVTPNQVAPDCIEFFVNEYRLDYEVHRYPKPIVAWMDAVTMGGGIGLSNGASHRVVTERSKLAMPEITIGLYPDVGGTWFLNKIPSGLGLFVGVTGARLNASDSLLAGLADFCVPSDQKEQVLRQLQNVDWSSDVKDNHGEISSILNSWTKHQKLALSNIELHHDFLSRLSKSKSVVEFREALIAYPKRDEWIASATKVFESGSPSSAQIIFKQLTLGRDLDLEAVFRSELNLSCQCTIHPDFAEGVRALLVDKDLAPKWHPSSLNDITEEWVASYFAPLWSESEHPLRDLGA